ncbi:MAG: hypothetical protein HFJ32_04440 [Clostridia bacterium]|nr:hypothetical protein [Clostridia bacterium]
MANKKTADIKITFVNEGATDSFTDTLARQFPNCTFQKRGGDILIWASKKTLTKIRSLSEEARFGKRAISIYTAC